MRKLLLIVTALLFAGSVHARTGEARALQVNVTARYDWYFRTESYCNACVSAGCRFNRENYLGLETGFGIDTHNPNNYYSIPLLADYIHYYPLGKSDKHSVYVGAEAGLMLYYGQWTQDQKSYLDYILFPSGKIGFDFSLGNKGPHLIVGGQINFWGAGATLGLSF
ncbi:MAG: hypothetical protein IKX60_06460 [Bacteroidales bacterium]|nr:hypothetical protein [Bacteroidales bacterium]